MRMYNFTKSQLFFFLNFSLENIMFFRQSALECNLSTSFEKAEVQFSCVSYNIHEEKKGGEEPRIWLPIHSRLFKSLLYLFYQMPFVTVGENIVSCNKIVHKLRFLYFALKNIIIQNFSYIVTCDLVSKLYITLFTFKNKT